MFSDAERLKSFDLIVPVWSMGKIEQQSVENILSAVESGVELAGCHGGMCDAFRENTDWQFLTGAQWVAHPETTACPIGSGSKEQRFPHLKGIDDFDVVSETVLPARRPGGQRPGHHALPCGRRSPFGQRRG